MTADRRAVDVFWNLATLMDDYAFELPADRVAGDAIDMDRLPPDSRVCLPLRRGQLLADVTGTAGQIVAAGMRPVVVLEAPDPAEVRCFDQALGELAAVGARECVLLWPATASLTEALDDVTGIIRRCDPGRRGYTDIGIGNGGHGALSGGHGALDGGHGALDGGHGALDGGHEPSADLLRAFEDAGAACVDHDVGLTLLSPVARSADVVIAWERVLRAAGNFFPVRVRLPGIAANPFRRTVPVLLGLAAAAQQDPGCQIFDVQFILRDHVQRTSVFADEIRRGNFVVEAGIYGYQLSMLRERKL